METMSDLNLTMLMLLKHSIHPKFLHIFRPYLDKNISARSELLSIAPTQQINYEEFYLMMTSTK